MVSLKVLAVCAFALPYAACFNDKLASKSSPWKWRREHAARAIEKRDVDPSLLYPAYNFSVPIDHFHNESRYEPHSDGFFNLRYWFDASNYKPGGPVIVLQSGETSGVDRLPYLQKGILAQLAQVTNGIGVVLEHRYYGKSWPVPDLSTENLRFLTTQQALADEAYFAQHIKFPGLDECGDLTSKTTAYLGYGGSYAGAFNAFLRVLYPDVFWGTISSSGVTKAIYNFWEYFEPIRMYGPKKCIHTQQVLTHVADEILLGGNQNRIETLKAAFGLPNVTYDDDFASVLSDGILGWQSLNWDPADHMQVLMSEAVSDPSFYQYCDNITSTSVLYPETAPLRETASNLITSAGYLATTSLVNQMLNYIGWVNLTTVQPCADEGATQDECFSQHNATFYHQDTLDDDWRSWPYQYCTQWGYIQTGSGVPKNELPIVSRTLTLKYLTIICREAFNIHTPPNLEEINQYGGYDISYPRLAIVDGQWDVWRPATPHAFQYGARHRVSTIDEPFILISEAIHHWDENGLFPNQTTASLPPAPIRNVQNAEHQFVLDWMTEWKSQGRDLKT